MWLANRLFRSVRRLQAQLAEAQRRIAVPPHSLRSRVGRKEDEQDARQHLTGGATVMYDIGCLLRNEGRQFTDFSRVLDFGCGCGRAARWAPIVPSLTACDIDAEAIAWCRANLIGKGQFIVNDHWPPLPFDDAAFDFIYCISVFTHLPEDMEQAWLAELRRVLEPGGLLLATVATEYVCGP